MDVAASNAAIKSGKLGEVIGAMIERWKPEAAYFTAVDGCRGGYIVFDLKDPSDIPVICEPFFHEFGAKLELMPCMTAEEVGIGVGKAFS